MTWQGKSTSSLKCSDPKGKCSVKTNRMHVQQIEIGVGVTDNNLNKKNIYEFSGNWCEVQRGLPKLNKRTNNKPVS